jgi:hypothetical protein
MNCKLKTLEHECSGPSKTVKIYDFDAAKNHRFFACFVFGVRETKFPSTCEKSLIFYGYETFSFVNTENQEIFECSKK